MVEYIQDDFIYIMHGTGVCFSVDMNIQLAQAKRIVLVFCNQSMHTVGDWITWWNRALHKFTEGSNNARSEVV